MSTPIKNTEYTGVLRLVNCYAAFHVKGNTKQFLSDHPEIDFRIAFKTAEIFANMHHIPFGSSDIFNLQKPIITILKHDCLWYPTELHSDKMTLLTNWETLNLSGTQEQVMKLAKQIADARNCDFVPSIGISLSK
jgi:hypothetical protein